MLICGSSAGDRKLTSVWLPARRESALGAQWAKQLILGSRSGSDGLPRVEPIGPCSTVRRLHISATTLDEVEHAAAVAS